MTPNPAILTFDYASFIAQIPAYNNPNQFPESVLQNFWNAATYYVSNVGNFGSLQGDARQYALNLMTAHLVYISQMYQRGQTPYVLAASTIDKVQITSVPVPIKNQWAWWLQISGYGMSLNALLQVNSVGGVYIGGSPTISAFRRGYRYGIPF